MIKIFNLEIDLIAAIALILTIPALILSLYNFIKNRFKLNISFSINEYVDLFIEERDIKTGRPIHKPTANCRIEGVFEYVNYSNLDFNIVKMTAVHNKEKYTIYKRNPVKSQFTSVLAPYEPQENLHIAPRSSGKECFSMHIPKELECQDFEVKIKIAYRHRIIKVLMKPISGTAIIENNDSNNQNKTKH